MATVEQQPSPALAVSDWPDAERSKASRYLAQRLAETRADFKSVAVAGFVLSLAVAGLAWLGLGILFEHWWLAGGMPVWLRWTWLLAGLAGAAAATVRWLLPLLRYRVNLVYAARTIEQEFPELHNDLVNAVLVRPQGNDPRADFIARSLDHRAARQLTSVPVDGVIDKQHLVRLAAVLAMLVIGASLYALFSPKNPFVSAARLLAPWSSWSPPSRVTISAVECFWTTAAEDVRQAEMAQPLAGERLFDPRRLLPVQQDAVRLVRGRQLVLMASIDHLRSDEIPTVGVTPLLDDGSVDRRAEPWEATLRRATEPDRYLVRLPSAAAGLDRSVRLSLAAGDARAKPLTVLVIDAPSLLVREAEYRFPDYTGRPPETRQWQGDLRGLEGTEVMLEVESNQPLDAAWIDFLDTEREDDLRLAIDAKQPTLARTSLILRMAADRAGAEHPSYRLRFRPREEQDIGAAAILSEPLTHRIEVLPDLAPEVVIDEPEDDTLRVPPRAAVRIRVRAVDPDYSLSSVRVETRPQGGGMVRERMLWRAEPTKPDARASSGLRVSTRVVPAEDAAGAGVLEYRAVVLDSRQPEPNTAATPWRQLIIDELAPPPADPESQWPERKPEDQGRGEQDAGDASMSESSGAADSKPEQPAGKDASEQPSGDDPNENQPRQADDQQQPGKQGGESGMQDASGTAGPKEGQGQQGSQSAQQQPGQPGAGQQQPQAGSSPEDGKAGDPQGSRGQPAGKPTSDATNGDRGGQAAGDQQQPGGKAADGRKPSMADGGEERPGDGEQRRQDGQQRPGNDAQAARNGEPQDRKPGGQEQAAKNGERTNGEPAAAPPPKPTVASDGTDDGEAMERILDHQRRQAGQQSDNQQQGECKAKNGEPCGEAGCSTCNGGGAAGGGKPGGGKPGGGKPGGGKPGGGQPGGGQPGGAAGPGPEGSTAGGQKRGDDSSAAGDGADAERGQPPGAAAAGGDQPGAGDQPANGTGRSDGADPAGQTGEDGNTPAESDANSAAGQPGGGQPGDQANPQSAGQPGDGNQSGDNAAGSGAAGGTPAGSTAGGGGGGRDGGDQSADRQEDGDASQKPLEWERQDLSTVRRAADLALEHLRDSVRSGDDEVLDELGWNREQAEAFLSRWEAMRQAAVTGAAGEREFEQTLRSLGLRPEGVRSAGQVPTGQRGPQAESRRTRPPLDYRERFKAYLKGTDSRLERE